MTTTLIELRRLGVLAAIMACVPASAASLIQNGNFDETRPYDPDWPLSQYNPPVPAHWQVAPFSEDGQLAGGDVAQNFAVTGLGVSYGDVTGSTGFLLAMNNFTHVEQSFTVEEGGEYRIAWSDAAPQTADYDDGYLISTPEARGLRYALTLDGAVLFQRRTRIGDGFVRRSFLMSLEPGTYTLGFRGLDHGKLIRFGSANQYGAQTVTYVGLFDNVSVSLVPEPQSYVLMLAGLGAVGWAGARRRRNATGKVATATPGGARHGRSSRQSTV